MRVMVLGGTGFVGRHAAAALRARGHAVVVGTRHPKRALAKLPPGLRDCELRETHFESLTTRYIWKPLLQDVDAVVNAVGILRERGGETYDRVHNMAPAALGEACARLGLRLIHVSALG
ncbi:MAG TPA: NAD-dependent epimerase/dehydratase family protein, partial [Burkholderiales bacterium]|nr:NAD-dependent epimerase/dehydratase family protein [Burkholderiales bacterium]